ncbi:dinitrogenase iron-molybdenum cofactor biosynthesis protein [Halorhodospira halophila]|nr:dinitrogenase iron-molybdenum cofactor biosynthesis protein [Halorhodospira halophila]MBK1729781.1 hypothetical protein [Halorhodospira halophila]
MQQDASLQPELALRIGLAARELPELDVSQLVRVLTALLGAPLTAEKLAGVTPRGLRDAGGAHHLEAVQQAPAARLEAACRALHGEEAATDPVPEPESGPSPEGAIRVACASNTGEELDGHFGACTRFLIYDVAATGCRLADVRPVAEAVSGSGTRRDDRIGARVALIADCQVLYCCSIGGPAAAKVVNAGVFPMKRDVGGAAGGHMKELSAALAKRPPPWLAKLMAGRSAAAPAS